MAFKEQKYKGSGSLNVSFNPDISFMLESVRFTLGSASSTVEDFTCVLDSADGSEYDVQLITQAMEEVKTFVHPFAKETKFSKGDKFTFAYANSDSKTWGLEIRTLGVC
jgi:hypothetical protein